MHWRRKADITAEVRRGAGWLAKRHKVGSHDRITVGLEWRPKVRRKRDGGENLAVLLKPLIDGLVDAGVVRDDEDGIVTRRMPTLLPVGEGEPGMWLIVEVPA